MQEKRGRDSMSWRSSARFKLRILLVASLAIAGVISSSLLVRSQTPAPRKQNYEFTNGQWFDGRTFKKRIFYSVGGRLTKRKPRHVDQVIDLGGGFVVPPFGDAHNHFPDSEGTLSWANSAFLQAGVFYVLNPNDIGELSNPIRSKLGTATTIDVVFAHGGFTKPGGHPTALYESLVDRKIYNYQKSELEGRAFYSIASTSDIDKKWPVFLATNPDFVKLFLLHSELYSTPEANQISEGLRPNFLRELAGRAKAAGLRSGAHIESASDFHNAVVGGVSMIMHLPGYHWRQGDTEATYLITEADARLAAKKRVPVVTTAALVLRDTTTKMRELEQATQIKNLRRLKAAHVSLVLGTDLPPGQGALEEFDYLKGSGAFSNLELLKMWCEATPLAIFPHRLIGHLREGYEANFLVLSSNPLNDLGAVKQIKIRVKDGEVLK